MTLRPLSFKNDFPENPALAAPTYPSPALSVREVARPLQRSVGKLNVEIRPGPLTLVVRNAAGPVRTFAAGRPVHFARDMRDS